MKVRNLLFGLFILCSFLLISAAFAQEKQVVVYYPEWRIAENGYSVKDFEKSGAAKMATVIIYAFCEPSPDSTGNIEPKFMNSYSAYQQPYTSQMSIDGAADDSTQPLRGQFNQLLKMKKRHPNIKILISIGGWTGSEFISDALLTEESRERFADEIIDRYINGNLPVARNAGGKGVAAGIFDGVDFDWEYPLAGGNEGIHHNDKDNDHLTEFYNLLRDKLNSINPAFLLTAAIPGGETYAVNYNLHADQKYLNWYNLMTYDFAGGWSARTVHHTNLLTSQSAPPGMQWSFDQSIQMIEKKFGVAPEKIVPGVAFYGRGWKGVDSTNFGLYQAAGGPAPAVGEDGFAYYPDLIRNFSSPSDYHWDKDAMAPWIYDAAGRVFWSFDDPKSISLKVHYVEAYRLGGIMCWEVSGDDSIGTLLSDMVTGAMPYRTFNASGSGKSRPHVEIAVPGPTDTLRAGTCLIINTDVSDSNGAIQKVEFFVDGNSIGYDVRYPFDWVWFNLPAGKHEVVAVATDNLGNSSRSRLLTLTVNDK